MDLASLIVGLIGGFWGAYTFHRKIQVENILQERTKWREEIRQITKRLIKNQTLKDNKDRGCQDNKSLLQAEIESDLAELQTKLNPADKFDLELLIYARNAFGSNIKFSYELIEKESSDTDKDTEKNKVLFLEKIAVLLKSDWERAKNDTTIFQHYFLESNLNYWKEKSYKQADIEKIIQTQNDANQGNPNNKLKKVLGDLYKYWKSIKFNLKKLKLKNFCDIVILIILASGLYYFFPKLIGSSLFSQNVSPVINNIISIFIKN